MFVDSIGLEAGLLIAAIAFAFIAGVVKGTTGFALPMIMISSLGSFLSPEMALAGLILPTVVANLWQAFRQGLGAAIGSAKNHWRYLVIVLICIAISSQFVKFVPAGPLFTIVGATITTFTTLQLIGWRPKVDPNNRHKAELGIGAVAGTLGGFTGTWGPPTVLYLTALDTPKQEHVRVQGVVYGAGAVVLTLAHIRSGVLAGEGLRLSALLLVPVLIGVVAGFAVQDRLDQNKFRFVVMVVLLVAGLNLIRRGVFG